MAQPYNSFEADKQRFRMWLAGILLVLVVLAVAGWLGRSHYRHFKEHRAQTQAQACLARGDYRNALLSARLALLLNPANAPACRVMAALADIAQNAVALDYLRVMVQTEPTIENKLLLASAALRYQSRPYLLTGQILDELAPAATNLAAYQAVAADWAGKLGRRDDAENHYATAARLDPTNVLYALNLAIVRLGATNAAQAAPARAALENLRTDPNLGVFALRALVMDRLVRQDAAAAAAYGTQLLANPKAALPDQLQYLGILRQLHSADYPARLQAVQQSAATNAVTVLEVAAWMQAEAMPAEELAWLTNLPAVMQAQTPVRVALAKVYLQAGDWNALRDFTAQGNWEEMEFFRLALASRAWSQLGVPQVAHSNWGSAVTAAGSRYSALIQLLDFAQRWQLPRERRDLLAHMFEKFPGDRGVQMALGQMYLAAGDTAALNRVYARLFALFPGDLGHKNDLAYTCLLLQTNLPQACQWAAEAYAGQTNNPATAATYAYALQVQGRTRDGLAVLGGLDRRSVQTPDLALFYAVLLAASGDTNGAAPYWQIARAKSDWLPEEKKLLPAGGP
jgi:Flp pilus assembly protein TadD